MNILLGMGNPCSKFSVFKFFLMKYNSGFAGSALTVYDVGLKLHHPTIPGGGGGVSGVPNFFLSFSCSWVEIRLHFKIQLSMLHESALNVSAVRSKLHHPGGWGGGQVTPICLLVGLK